MVKIGDLVRYIGEDREVPEGKLRKGFTYRVVRIDPDDREMTYKISLGGGKERWIFNNNLEETTCKSVRIDLTDPRGAHMAVEKALGKFKEQEKNWTGDEINEAEELFKELLTECVEKGFVPYFRRCGNGVSLWVYEEYTESELRSAPLHCTAKYFAVRSGKDIFNEKIGQAVCLCKALGKPIPDFIREKNKK